MKSLKGHGKITILSTRAAPPARSSGPKDRPTSRTVQAFGSRACPSWLILWCPEKGAPYLVGERRPSMDTIFPHGSLSGPEDVVTPTETSAAHPGQRQDGAVVPTALLDDFRLTTAAMRYYAVAMREPGLELDAIARRIKTSSKTARRARTALLSAGWMEIVTIQGPQGSRTEHHCLPVPARLAS